MAADPHLDRDDPHVTDVRVVAWPRQRHLVTSTRSAGKPILVVVDDDNDPPAAHDCCEDWMWRSGGEREMRVRVHHLTLKAMLHRAAAPTLDEYGTLRVGLRTVQLPPKERLVVARLLQDFGRPVPRDGLLSVGWPHGVSGPNVIASRISALRSRLRWLGLQIVGSAGGGYVLQVAEAPARDAPAGDEDDVHAPEVLGQGERGNDGPSVRGLPDRTRTP